MTYSHSWRHIVPFGQTNFVGSLDLPTSAASNKIQAGHELLGVLQRASSIKGRLPTLEELPRTRLSINPRNKTEGSIAFLQPGNDSRAVGYCFFEASSHEAMTEIASRYEDYIGVCKATTFPPGRAPLEHLPLELFRQITEGLWTNDQHRFDERDVRSLSAVSTTIRNRLLEVQKVNTIHKRCASLASLRANLIQNEHSAIAKYALSNELTTLVGKSLLAAFNHIAQAYRARYFYFNMDTGGLAIEPRTFIDTSIRFIERMQSDDAAKALSIINDFPEADFSSFARQYSDESAIKLVNIVTKMNDPDVKVDGIASVGNMLRLGGTTNRSKILYVAQLLEQAKSLKVGHEAISKICRSFKRVRTHLALYCSFHYDTSASEYPRYHDPLTDTEESMNTDLETGRKLDAFLVQNGCELESIRSILLLPFRPFWEAVQPATDEQAQSG